MGFLPYGLKGRHQLMLRLLGQIQTLAVLMTWVDSPAFSWVFCRFRTNDMKTSSLTPARRSR
jgi:hypothetical protein